MASLMSYILKNSSESHNSLAHQQSIFRQPPRKGRSYSNSGAPDVSSGAVSVSGEGGSIGSSAGGATIASVVLAMGEGVVVGRGWVKDFMKLVFASFLSAITLRPASTMLRR